MSNNHNIKDEVLLICGTPATGKSTSLEFLENPEGVLYLNCDHGKKLPFKSKFIDYAVTNPDHVPLIFNSLETKESIRPNGEEHSTDKIHTIVIDTINNLMSLVESKYVDDSVDSRVGWNIYYKYITNLMSQSVATSSRNVIFLAHVVNERNETNGLDETFVKLKGSIMRSGLESYFSTILMCKKKLITELKNYDSDYLNISETEKSLGYKHVYQTLLTKATINERIRSPKDMWSIEETYIDNNVQHVLHRLKDFYGHN